jgi:hypothetical protein
MNWPLTVLTISRRVVCTAVSRFVGRVATHVLDAGLVQAQGVAQLGSGGADRHVDVAARGEPMHGQAVDDAQRHGL